MLRPSPSSTLFPYTTLFRSGSAVAALIRNQNTCLRWRLPPGALQIMNSPTRAHVGCWIAICLSMSRSEEHTSELQSRRDLVCRLLLEKKNANHLFHHKTHLV